MLGLNSIDKVSQLNQSKPISNILLIVAGMLQKIDIYDLYLKYIHANILHYALNKILHSPDYIACMLKEDICRSV